MRLSPKTLALAATSIFLSLTFIDETGVAVTLPAMSESLGLTQLGIQWVMNAFFVTLTVSVLGFGRLADMVGHRKAFLWGLLAFMISSVGAAVAFDGTTMICARVGQGMGAALMLATYAVLLGRVFPSEEQGMALGTSASIASVFLATGPFIGGFFANMVSWRAIFWINLPLGILTWVATIKAIPRDNPNDHRDGFDFGGCITFLIGFGALILVLMQAVEWGWGSAKVAIGISIAMIGLSAFYLSQLRHVKPLADFRLFRDSTFLAANVILMTTQLCVMAITFWALWLQISLDFDPLRAGLLLLPSGLPILIMGRVGGRWADRSGPHEPIRIGALLCLTSMVWMAITLPRNNYWFALAGMLLYGFGAPLVISPAIKIILAGVSPAQQGVASGMLNTMRQLGAALCFGAVGAVVNMVDRGVLSNIYFPTSAQIGALPRKGFDAAQLIAAARLEADTDIAGRMLDVARITYGNAIGVGMWVAAAFAAIGLAFAVFGLNRPLSTTLQHQELDRRSLANRGMK